MMNEFYLGEHVIKGKDGIYYIKGSVMDKGYKSRTEAARAIFPLLTKSRLCIIADGRVAESETKKAKAKDLGEFVEKVEEHQEPVVVISDNERDSKAFSFLIDKRVHWGCIEGIVEGMHYSFHTYDLGLRHPPKYTRKK